MKTAKELLDLIDRKEQEIQQAEREKANAFEQLSREHGKQFQIGDETKLVIKRVSKGGPVRYHFRSLGKGALKVEETERGKNS